MGTTQGCCMLFEQILKAAPRQKKKNQQLYCHLPPIS